MKAKTTQQKARGLNVSQLARMLHTLYPDWNRARRRNAAKNQRPAKGHLATKPKRNEDLDRRRAKIAKKSRDDQRRQVSRHRKLKAVQNRRKAAQR